MNRTRDAHIVAAAALSIVIAGIYGVIAWGMFIGSPDFQAHLGLARQMYATGRLPAPHFLFHAAAVLLFAAHLVPSLLTGARVVLVISYVLIALVMYGLLWLLFRNSTIGRPSILFPAALATLLAQPITRAHAFKIGFLWPEAYQIPTSTVLKPFAMVSFACTAWYVSRGGKVDSRVLTLFSLATLAGCLAKPSFIICLLPASVLLLAYRLGRRMAASLWALAIGLYIPAAAVLAWQFYEVFSGYGSGLTYHNSIAWGPLWVMRFWSSQLLSKFLLSICFPLLLTCLYWKQACRDTLMQLGWLCFLVGAFYSYLLVEKTNWSAGNMVWSGYITLFTLFVASTVFWLRQLASAIQERAWSHPKVLMSGVALAVHAISGARLDWLYLAHYGCALNFRTAEFVCGG